MKINTISIICYLLIFADFSFPQSLSERYEDIGELLIPEFASAPFPDVKRMNGHVYDNKTYSFKEHYNDSSVAIFIPKGFKPDDAINLVIYFHGWYNNIDSACNQFRLLEQFYQSRRNAVFVFPEGPKNSPDSYGGRLELKDGLKLLVQDVFTYLKGKGKVKSTNPGKIILAGHSGAFRVMAFCLTHGGLTQNISDVILFDALYSQTEKYIHWIENYNGRFINIYTDQGGTKTETENMMNDFDAWGVSYLKIEENQLTQNDLINNRILFIHTDLTHNEVIDKRNQFLKYLKTSKVTER